MLEAAYTLLGLVNGSPTEAIVVVFRWSAPAGVVLMVALLISALLRRRAWVAVVVGLIAVRVVTVLVAVLVVGSDDPNGRADGSYLLIAFFGTVVPLVELFVASSVLRVLRGRTRQATSFSRRT